MTDKSKFRKISNVNNYYPKYEDPSCPGAGLMGWEYEVYNIDEDDSEGQFDYLLSVNREDWDNSDNDEYRSPVGPYSFHKEFAIPQFNEIITERTSDPYNAGAGIHVHIDRSHVDMDRIFRFMHNTEYRRFWLNLSQRPSGQFDAWSMQGSPSLWSGHGRIINCENARTYEMRLFNAREDLLLPAVQLSECLMRLSASPGITLTPDTFKDFVANQDMPELTRCVMAAAA